MISLDEVSLLQYPEMTESVNIFNVLHFSDNSCCPHRFKINRDDLFIAHKRWRANIKYRHGYIKLDHQSHSLVLYTLNKTFCWEKLHFELTETCYLTGRTFQTVQENKAK